MWGVYFAAILFMQVFYLMLDAVTTFLAAMAGTLITQIISALLLAVAVGALFVLPLLVGFYPKSIYEHTIGGNG